ncbi:MAG: hypothetical protein JRJ04_05035 [Deltaproteobacteria bacterium]|nr:hypothetical protein [Deltaproteobacteria bacterium]
MMERDATRIKPWLIGLAFAKIGISLLYMIGTLSVSEFFFHQQTAVAQEKTPKDTVQQTDTQLAAKPKDPIVDVRDILKRLDSERKRLQKEEARIKQQRVQLEQLKEEIEEKIERLSMIQKQIASDLDKKQKMLEDRERRQKAAEEANMKMLGKVYASMKPKQAAAIVDKMDIDIIQKIFSYMKGEQVGNILSYVDKELAAKISERLAEKYISFSEPEKPTKPQTKKPKADLR